ncbi:MAG TPA: hypothetical protein VI306_08485 [Pyrinomonadaceae bacterium]
MLQEHDTLQQFAQDVGEIAGSYHENLQALNGVTPQQQFAAEYGAGLENSSTQETVAGFATQYGPMIVSATNGGIPSLSNPGQQAARGIDLGMVHQPSTAADRLEQVRQKLDRVSTESIGANEPGMGAGIVADTEAAVPDALAALL